jgi:hypothetical protein
MIVTVEEVRLGEANGFFFEQELRGFRLRCVVIEVKRRCCALIHIT